jgi:SAM-dependent methyltransferase
MWARQEKRADLADGYWRLAGARPGWRVADVGCGAGYFAMRYASMTGPTGHVHAVDVDEDALAYLRARLDPVHHAHVTTEALDVERAPLPDLHFDALFCTHVLHHARDPAALLRNLRASKAPLVLCEFDPRGPGELGPPLAERLAPDVLVDMLQSAGWSPRPWLALKHESYAILAR